MDPVAAVYKEGIPCLIGSIKKSKKEKKAIKKNATLLIEFALSFRTRLIVQQSNTTATLH